MPVPPTENPTDAGTAPVDPTNIAPEVDAKRMEEGAAAAAAGAGAEGGTPGPIGGEATVAATSWGGAKDEELDSPA